jgi:O-methyltransferase
MRRPACPGSLSVELRGTSTTPGSSAGRRAAFRALRRAWIGLRGDRVWRLALRRSPPTVRRRLLRLRASVAIWGRHTLVPVDELHDVYRRGLSLLMERNGRESIGDYLEFGVYIGTSLACMHRVADELGLRELRLVGFDSFEGLPAHAREDEAGMWEPGSFASDEESTRRNLMREGVDWSRVVLVPGWFDETLTPATADAHGIRKASVVMFDCDLYASTRQALEFTLPLIVDEAVLVFDDWDAGGLGERGLGERRAFEEILAEHPDDLHTVELPAYEPARAFLVSRRGPISEPEIQGLTPGVTKA